MRHDRLDEINNIFKKQQQRQHIQKIRTRVTAVLSCIAVLLTIYALVLPAAAIDKQNASDSAGLTIEVAAAPTEMQGSPAYLAGEFTVSGEDFSVTAAVPESACLPHESQLKVDEIIGDEYDLFYTQALEALGVKSMPYARFFDIRFEVLNDGVWTEVEPQDTVSITIDTGRTAAEGENPFVLHYTETVSEEVEENADVPESEVLTGALEAAESEELTGASENAKAAETAEAAGTPESQELTGASETSGTPGSQEIAETPETSPEHRGTTDSRDSLDEEAVALTGEMQVTEIPASQEEGEQEITFETQSFSVFGVGYTVDYTYEGYTCHMPGGNSMWLSVLLDLLHTDASIENVLSVEFSNDTLMRISQDTEEYDWLLESLMPFDTDETLTVTLTDGRVLVITVTDDQPQNLGDGGFLTLVEVYDNNIYVGGSDNPTGDTMLVRTGHQYMLKLVFAEDEDTEGMQFTDTGSMIYQLPDNITLHDYGSTEGNTSYFDIVLGKKNTLKDNKVIYHPAEGNEKAYLEIKWNTLDKKNFKLLTASPRATFTLNFNGAIIEVPEEGTIEFANGVTLDVTEDPDYEITLHKTAEVLQDGIIKYQVEVLSDGMAKNIKVSDEMGEALTFLNDSGHKLSVAYEPAGITYGNDNYELIPAAEGQPEKNGFDLKLKKLYDGNRAIITYYAQVDYTKLGGKENIAQTSQNSVTAFDVNDEFITTETHTLEDELEYLKIAKSVGDYSQMIFEPEEGVTPVPTPDPGQDGEGISGQNEPTPAPDPESANYGNHSNWETIYVPWTVVYNPDQNVDVEGSTLHDMIYKGATKATTYDTSREFTVTAYANGKAGHLDLDTGVFTPADGDTGIVIKNDWQDVIVTDYVDADHPSSWTWTIPEKSSPLNTTDPVHYTYVIKYWTKVERNKSLNGGYIRNQVSESYAGLTCDRPRRLPGDGTDYEITVDKRHIEDVYVPASQSSDDKSHSYSKWEISFDRPAFYEGYSLEAAIAEDTLPHIRNKNDGYYADRFIGEGETLSQYATNKGVFAWNQNSGVSGLIDGETCIPVADNPNHSVRFWFYKGAINVQGMGLKARDGDSDHDRITITFWTDNDMNWIEAAAKGEVTSEHLNHVHLILDGYEASNEAVGTPEKDPEITKKRKPEKVGTWTNSDGISMPIYRYTITLTGMTDHAFQDRKLIIEDTFEPPLKLVRASELSNTQIKLSENPADTDERLVRTIPDLSTGWVSDAAGEKAVTITPLVDENQQENGFKIEIPYDEAMKYRPERVDAEGNILKDKNGNTIYGDPIYGQEYQISYYMTLDHQKVKEDAQDIVTRGLKSKEYTDKKANNTATWKLEAQSVTSPPTPDSQTPYTLNPVSKDCSYDAANELATYTIEVNPLKLTMNRGERYALTDEYENLAVDFETVRIVCDPEYVDNDPTKEKQKVEWTYHGSKGTYWIPDNTKVTITYEGWPVGIRGSEVTFRNTASVMGYTADSSRTDTLKADHEGSAASYRIRLFKFGDDNMDDALPGAVFQLFENDENGNMVPMQYKTTYHNTGTDADDPAWARIVKTFTDDLIVYPSDWDKAHYDAATLPKPENHNDGDLIFFISGEGDPEEDNQGRGFAEIMLSQARDGVALKKNHQYYLREVIEPEGYMREDIYWRFIIGENDDWSHYIYADDSVMQVSNASKQHMLEIRKDFVNRSSSAVPDDWDFQKNVLLEIVGRDAQNNVIYNKTIPRGDFKKVSVVQADGTTGTEYMVIIRHLDPGTYTVTEIRDSAVVKKTVEQDGQEVRIEDPAYRLTTELKVEGVDSAPLEEADTGAVFEVGETTSAKVGFTNIYTDKDTAKKLTITKDWEGEKKEETVDGETVQTQVYTGEQVKFALYADGMRYTNLTEAEGADADGYIVLPRNGNKWSVTLDNLPGKKGALHANDVEGWVTVPEVQEDQDIVWTVEEVEAAYRMAGAAADTAVSGPMLTEHFKVTPGTTTTAQMNENNNEGTASFTNTLNDLVTVNISKEWSDGNHLNDYVYFDLYRTALDVNQITDYAALVGTENAQLVEENVPLKVNEPYTRALQLHNSNGRPYHYFVVEHSVAGYTASYGGQGTPAITITNCETAAKGSLTISKAIRVGDGTSAINPSNVFRFTLTNSGKYLQADGTLEAARHEFDVRLNGESTSISNIPVGTYLMTEVADSAQIGGYHLDSMNVTATNGSVGDVSGNQVEVTIGNGGATPMAVEVTNNYSRVSETTGFQFGKLWVIPDPTETTTLPWPYNTRITMNVYRRLKGETNEVDPVWSYTIANTKTQEGDASFTISKNPENAPDLIRQTGDQYADQYNHYTFRLDGLEKYDENGREWEYYAMEEGAVTRADGTVLNDKTFETYYGYVDGIAARVVAGKDRAYNGECSINRLRINAEIKIPVQKQLDGRFLMSDNNYPAFEFQLYSETDRNTPVATAYSDASSRAEFDVTSLLSTALNEMKWWSYEKKLTGKYTFFIKETNYKKEGDNYNGITNIKSSAKVELIVSYDWVEGTLNIRTKVNTPGQQVGEEEDHAVITNTYDSDKVWLKVSKHWDDDNNRDNLRWSARFKIHAWVNGVERTGDEAVWFLKKDSNGNTVQDFVAMPKVVSLGTRTDASQMVKLPKYYEGEEISYTVEEVMSEEEQGVTVDHSKYYTSSLDHPDNTNNWDFTNTHVPETVDIAVNKIWHNESLPAHIAASRGAAVVLKADGELKETVELDSSNNNAYTWEKLPKYKPGFVGREIRYTVEEQDVPLGYLCEVTAEKETEVTTQTDGEEAVNHSDDSADYEQPFTVTNTYVPTSISATKVWDDDHNRDGMRRNVTVRLTATADGQEIDFAEVAWASEWAAYAADPNGTLTENEWTKKIEKPEDNAQSLVDSGSVCWTCLPKYYLGKEITYSVDEVDLPVGYTKQTTRNDDGSFMITNTHRPETVSVTLTKTWDDAENQDGYRPGTAEFLQRVRLMADGVDVSSSTIRIGDHALKDIVRQPSVQGGDGKNGTMVTDTYVVTYTGLPKYKDFGDLIGYTVEETDSNGTALGHNGVYDPNYSVSVAMHADSGDVPQGNRKYAVTNKHVPETLRVRVTKNWSTEPGAGGFGVRNVTQPVHVTLKAKLQNPADSAYMDIDTHTAWIGYKTSVKEDANTSQTSFVRELTSDGVWQADWIDVPKYAPGEVGKLLTYTVFETAADLPLGYRVVDGSAVSTDAMAEMAVGTQLTVGETTLFSNIYEEVPVNVTKTWKDDNNRDGKRYPVTVKLIARKGSENGAEIPFTDPAWQKYTAPSDGGTGTVPGNGSISDGIWTNTITVDNVLANTDAAWDGGWTCLPKYYQGESVYYSVEEINIPSGSGYTISHQSTVRNSDGSFSTAITNTRESTTVTSFGFTKHWDDANNQDNKRPDPESFILNNVRVYMDHANIGGTVYGDEHYTVMLVPQKDDTSGNIYLYYYRDTGEPLPIAEGQAAQVMVQGASGPVPATVTWVGSNGGGYLINNHGTPDDPSDDTAFMLDEDDESFDYNCYSIAFHNMPKHYLFERDITYSMKEVQNTAENTRDRERWLFSVPGGEGVTAEQMHRYTYEDETVSNKTEYDIAKKTGENYVFEATNRHSPDTIQISVNKVWENKDSMALSQPASATVRLCADGVPVSGQTVILNETNGWSHTWTQLGTYYKYREGQVGQAVAYTVEEVGVPKGYGEVRSTSTTTEPGTTLECEVKNVYKTGNLRVEKTVVSDVTDDNSYPFCFSVTLTNLAQLKDGGRSFVPGAINIVKKVKKTPTDEVVTAENPIAFNEDGVAEFTLTHDQYVEIANLPIGAEYSVEEYERDASHPFLPNFTIDKTGDTGTIAADTTNRSSFTNTRKTGELELTKTVADTNKIPGDDDLAFTFTVNLTAPTVPMVDPNTHALEYSSKHIRYVIGRYQTVEDSREFVPEEGEGSAGYFEENRKSISLTHGKTVRITGLPVGTTYTVVESVPDSFLRVFTPAASESNNNGNAQGTINIGSLSTGGATDSVTATNTRRTGSLKLHKTVVSPLETDHENIYTLTVTLTRPGNPVSGTYSAVFTDAGGSEIINLAGLERGSVSFDVLVKGDNDVKISGIPADVLYTVSEKSPTPTYFNVSPTAYTDTDGTLDIPVSGTPEATVTNTRQLGRLKVEKNVVSDVTGDKTRNFNFTIMLLEQTAGQENQKVVVSDTITVNKYRRKTQSESKDTLLVQVSALFGTGDTASFELANDQYVEIDGLPVGVSYTVTETTQEDVFITKNGVSASALTTDGYCFNDKISTENESDTAVFRNERKTGELNLSKAVMHAIPATSDNVADADKTFNYKVTLTPPSGDSLSLTADSTMIRFYQKDKTSGEYVLKTGSEWKFGADGTVIVPVSVAQPVKITNVPVGTGYTVEEASTPVYSNITNSTKKPTGTFGLVTEEGENKGKVRNESAAFTNVRATGDLEISKEVTSPIAVEETAEYKLGIQLAPVPVSAEDRSLTITSSGNIIDKEGDADSISDNGSRLNFNDNGYATFYVRGGQTVKISGIPTDVVCTVTEIDNNSKFKVKYADVTSVEAAAEPVTDPDNPDASGSSSDPDTAIDSQNPSGQAQVAQGNVAELDVPVGLRIEHSGTYKSNVHNIRKTGSLSLGKNVISGISKDETEREFLFMVTISGDGSTGDVLKDGEYGGVHFTDGIGYVWLKNTDTKTISGLPDGFTYSVAELTSLPEGVTGTGHTNPSYADHFDTQWTWTQQVLSGNDKTGSGTGKVFPVEGQPIDNVLVDGKVSGVVFTNTRKTNELLIEKAVNSPFNSEKYGDYDVEIKLTAPTDETLKLPMSLTRTVTKWVRNAESAKWEQKTATDTLTIPAGESTSGPVSVVTFTIPVPGRGSVKLEGLPIDVSYSVAEKNVGTNYPQFNVSYAGGLVSGGYLTSDNQDGTIEPGDDKKKEVKITNTRKEIPVSLMKVSSTDASTPLEGAEFTMKLDETGTDGSSMTLRSDQDGYLRKVEEVSTLGAKVFTLQPGTYSLTETVAPAGYNMLAEPATFTVGDGSIIYTDSILGNDVEKTQVIDHENKVVILKVANSAGAELPATGGPGPRYYYLVGSMLTILAGGILLLRKRRRILT